MVPRKKQFSGEWRHRPEIRKSLRFLAFRQFVKYFTRYPMAKARWDGYNPFATCGKALWPAAELPVTNRPDPHADRR